MVEKLVYSQREKFHVHKHPKRNFCNVLQCGLLEYKGNERIKWEWNIICLYDKMECEL